MDWSEVEADTVPLYFASAEDPDTVVNCTSGEQWIWEVFGECITSSANLAAFILGFVSLLLWLIPLVPQVYINYKRKICDGLSIYFLIFWICGDMCNFVGALLTKQLPMQIYIGAYYVFADVVLLGQYLYYRGEQSERQVRSLLQQHQSMSRTQSTSSSSTSLAGVLCCVSVFGASTHYLTSRSLSSPNQYDMAPSAAAFSNRRLQHQFFHNGLDAVGYIIGIVSALLYFCGRVPQLIKNHRRRSTEGQSLAMFVIIVFANLTYGGSILLAGQGEEYILRHLPWLVGSVGCCAMDALVIAQYFVYDAPKRTPEEEHLVTGFNDTQSSDEE